MTDGPMDEIGVAGRDDEYALFRQLAAQYGPPAYVRRAVDVEAAFEDLLDRCRCQRDEWLAMVRIRLATVRDLAGKWESLRPLLADDEQLALLRGLDAELGPRLTVPVQPSSSVRVLRRALSELAESVERFNRRWRAYLAKVDVSQVNALRDGYNRYYLVEKECAMRSARLARQGFRRLEPLTVGDLLALLPLLPVGNLRRDPVR
jgi:hypothetical protein